QALTFAVVLLGLAALALVGLRDASERILDAVRDDRAGDAAAEAGAAVVADMHGGREMTAAQTAVFVARPDVAEAARAAAVRLAREHRRADPSDVSVHAFGIEVEVHVTLAGRQHIALLEPAP